MPTLKGMTWDHSRGYDPMVATAKAYASSHPGVVIDWEKRSLQAFADRPIGEMADRYDLMVIDHPHVGEIAQSGLLAALDQTSHGKDLNVLASQSVGLSHPSYAYDGHQWALAIDAATPVASYRPDLLDEPPESWDQVIALAGQGKVLWPIKPIDALMGFFNVAANMGLGVAVESDRLIDRPDGQAVLDALWAVARHMPHACLAMNPIEAYEWLSTGDDGRCYCPYAYGYSNYARPGYRPWLLNFADVAAHVPDAGPRGTTLGGTGIAVSSQSPYQDIAVDYAFWIASAEVQKGLFFTSGGQPGNAVAWDDASVNEAASDFFRDTRQTLETAWLRPRYDGYMGFQDEGGTIVNRFLAGDADAERTLVDLDAAYRRSRA